MPTTSSVARPTPGEAGQLADLADNSRLDRCILRVERVARDLARIHRYLLSYKFLTDRLSEQDYRSSRGIVRGVGRTGPILTRPDPRFHWAVERGNDGTRIAF